MLFAHLKRILRLDRLRLRGPSGAKDEFLLAATAQNLRKLARLIPLPTAVFATWGGRAQIGRPKQRSFAGRMKKWVRSTGAVIHAALGASLAMTIRGARRP
jgi:hypothetical protein